jgi:hypothetical protein
VVCVDDPEMTDQGFGIEEEKSSLHDFEDGSTTLVREPQDDDPRKLPWGIGSHIGEIEVESHEDALLVLTDLRDLPIARDTKSLLVYSEAIVTVLTEQIGGVGVEILVELELYEDAPTGRATTRSLASSAA